MKNSPPPPPPTRVDPIPPPRPPPTPPLPPSSSRRRSLPAPNTPPRTSITRSYESQPVQTPPRGPMISTTTGSTNGNETITTATGTTTMTGTHNPQCEEPNLPNLNNPTPNNLSSSSSSSPPTTITTHTTSRFKFHSDTKAPIQFSQLEQQTAQNITSFRLKLNAIDKQIANWNTTFVNEVVDRDKDLVGMLDYVCVDPLERCSERFFERLESKMGKLWGSSSENENGDGNGIGHGIIDKDNLRNNVDNDKVADKETDDNNMNNLNNNDQQEEEVVVEDVEEGDENAGIVEEETNEPIHHNQANKNNIEEESTTSKSNPNSTNSKTTKSSSSSSSPSIQSLSSQISSLSSNLNNYIHQTVPTQIQSFHKQYKNHIPSNIQLESLKATKREQSILSKFESMAGLTQKAYVQEKATTHAELTLLRDEVNVAGGYDEYRTSRFLSEIEDVRKLLEVEREKRKMKDELVLEKIVATREMLQKMVLDALVKYDE